MIWIIDLYIRLRFSNVYMTYTFLLLFLRNWLIHFKMIV